MIDAPMTNPNLESIINWNRKSICHKGGNRVEIKNKYYLALQLLFPLLYFVVVIVTKMGFAIRDGLVEKIELYRNKYWLARLDVFPFLIGYIAMFFFIFSEAEGDIKYTSLVGIPALLTLHLIIFLFAQSSVKLRCLIGKDIVQDVNKATYALVSAAKNAGKDRIVSIEHREDQSVASSINVLSHDYQLSPVFFQFQEVTYQFNKNSFERLDYPVETTTNNALKWVGFPSKEVTISAARRWGFNEFNIPLPHFLDLYMVSIPFLKYNKMYFSNRK